MNLKQTGYGPERITRRRTIRIPARCIMFRCIGSTAFYVNMDSWGDWQWITIDAMIVTEFPVALSKKVQFKTLQDVDIEYHFVCIKKGGGA